MRIIDIQARIRETGRIRLGEKGSKGAPKRLSSFRFTSPDRMAIDKIASIYGGKPKVWTTAPTEGQQWEVVTDVDNLDVIVPPMGMAISQAYESWSGGGIKRRCDGARELLTDQPCICATEIEDGSERLCKPTTRLNVMLPPFGAGVWRIESTGWNAAAELAGAELAELAGQRGRLQSARLRLETRTAKREGMTRHFVVPVLDLDIPLESATFTPVDQAALPEWPTPPIEEQLAAVNQPDESPPRKNRAAPIPPTEVSIEADGVAQLQGRIHKGPPEVELAPSVAAGRTLVDEATRRSIVIAAREAGLDDDQRHVFLLRFSDGAYESTKDVPVADVSALRAELVKLKETQEYTGEDIRDIAEDLGTKERDVVDVPLPGDDTWTADRWHETLRHVPGIGQAKLLRKARELASDLGQPLPTDLGAIQEPHLVTQLLAWLKAQTQPEDDDERPF